MTTPDVARKVRRSAAVVALGLLLQVAAALHWTPATFILSAVIGLPLVLVGGAMFLAAVWKNMRDKGAL